MPWGAAIGVGASLLGGAISSGAGDSQQAAANAADTQAQARLQQASALWSNLQVPTLSATPYNLESWLQNYTPQTYNANVMPITQMQDDASAKSQIDQAMSQLEPFAKGQLTPADYVTLNAIRGSQAASGTSASQGTIDQLRARGLGGSGAEEAAMLAGNQSAANSTSQLYNQALLDALSRQTGAIQAEGNLGTSERAQSDAVSQQMAQIANQFNENIMGLRTQAAADAANTQNAAQQFNIQGQQTTANTNTALQNQNIDRALQIQQQNFANQQGKVAGQGSALAGQAQGDYAQAAALGQQANAAEQNSIANIGNAINAGKTGYQIANPTPAPTININNPAPTTSAAIRPSSFNNLPTTEDPFASNGDFMPQIT